MAIANQGTIVTSPIRPATDADTYPTAYANEILGGYHTESTKVDRNSIPLARRLLGMQCRVVEDNITYTLINNPSTDSTQDSDWKAETVTASDIKLNNGNSIETEVTNITSISNLKYIQFSLALNNTDDNDEFISPFNATLKSVVISVPISSNLTSDTIVNLEKYNGTSWVTLCTLTIPISSASKIATYTPTNIISILTNDRLRINVTKIQSNIVTLNANMAITITTTAGGD